MKPIPLYLILLVFFSFSAYSEPLPTASDLTIYIKSHINKAKKIEDDIQNLESQIAIANNAISMEISEKEENDEKISVIEQKIEEDINSIVHQVNREMIDFKGKIENLNTFTSEEIESLENNYKELRKYAIGEENNSNLSAYQSLAKKLVIISTQTENLMSEVITEIPLINEGYNAWYTNTLTNFITAYNNIPDSLTTSNYQESYNNSSSYYHENLNNEYDIRKIEKFIRDASGLVDEKDTIIEQLSRHDHSSHTYLLLSSDNTSTHSKIVSASNQLILAINKLNTIKDMLENRESARKELLRKTYSILIAVCNQRLLNSNIEDAEQLLANATYSLNDEILYNEISSKHSISRSHIDRLQTRYKAYRKAKRVALEGLSYTKRIQRALSDMNISEPMKQQINAELPSQISRYQSELAQSNRALETEPSHFNYRNNIYNTALTQYRDHLSESCVLMAEEGMSYQYMDTVHEEKFIDFRGACL